MNILKLQQNHELPTEIAQLVADQLERIEQALQQEKLTKDSLPKQIKHELSSVLVTSDFISDQIIRYPKLFFSDASSDQLVKPIDKVQYRNYFFSLLEQVKNSAINESEWLAALRIYRKQQLFNILWQDFTGRSSLQNTLFLLSELAVAAIDSVVFFYQWQQENQFGIPLTKQQERQTLVVLGLGKLGGDELNVSSDVDLIFTYPEDGQFNGVKSKTYREYFTRLTQKVVQALDSVLIDGFVYRVDTRLRPYGTSGILVASFSAMEDYYMSQGREWERYALIKRRLISGDPAQGKQLLSMLQPFVYRKYLDFGVFDSLRDMKQMIVKSLDTNKTDLDIKKGWGGIREIEFIAQAIQLIWGGKKPELRHTNLLITLDSILKLNLLPEKVVKELQQGYCFLRRLENHLQGFNDRQTHELPLNELHRLRLAWSMGFTTWSELETQIEFHRKIIRNHFQNLVFSHQQETTTTPEKRQKTVMKQEQKEDWCLAWWQDQLSKEIVIKQLHATKFRHVEQVYLQLEQFRNSRIVLNLQTVARNRLDRLMPMIIATCIQLDNADEVWQRLLTLVDSIIRRSAYIALLVENPHAFNRLVKIVGISPWLAEQLATYPILLDELLVAEYDFDNLYDKKSLIAELSYSIRLLSWHDHEHFMDLLRQFKRAKVFRVALAEALGRIDVTEVSLCLSTIAEAIIAMVLIVAWQQTVAKYGAPKGNQTSFVVVGYGKLGSRELSYSSDLDLVFLYNTPSNEMTIKSAGLPETTHIGQLELQQLRVSMPINEVAIKPVMNSVFFTRLSQLMIHWLTTRTIAGKLYQVDVQLRPSGRSGMMVSSFDAFEKYQWEQAWTWEHQALVRARVVAGCSELTKRFNQVRGAILLQPKSMLELRGDIVKMRVKMHQSNSSKTPAGQFDLKQSIGGLLDVEFIAQYGALSGVLKREDILQHYDTLGLLKALGDCGFLQHEEVSGLIKAVIAYRQTMHQSVLQNQPKIVPNRSVENYSHQVTTTWRRLFES